MIYLDNAATTKVDQNAIDLMVSLFKKDFANPSALYDFGLEAQKQIELARKKISQILEVRPEEIYFTSCGTESNNMAIMSSITKNPHEEFIVSNIEHPSASNVFNERLPEGQVIKIKSDKKGFVEVDKVLEKVNQNTKLVSIMAVNNETGTIQPWEEIGQKIKEINKNILFHVDGIQCFGKLPINLVKARIDYFTFSAHKIHGPKGVGGLYVRQGAPIQPLIFGGGQEKGIRSGTENVPGIAALGLVSFEAYENMKNNFLHVESLKKLLYERIKDMEEVLWNSDLERTSPYIANFCFKDIKSEVLIHYLEMDKIYVSSGSACSKGKKSPTLSAMGVDKDYEEGCIRVSFSRENTIEEIEFFVDRLKFAVEDIRSIIRRK